MEVEEQVQGEGQEQVVEDQATPQDQTKEFQQRLEELEANYKAQIKGLDKKVGLLAKEKEALEMEKLTETERAEAEKQMAIDEAAAIRAETESLRRDRDLTKVLFDSGLDPELFGSRIQGKTVEEMESDVKALNEAIDKTVNDRVEKEVSRRLGGETPKAGDTPKSLDFAEQVKRAKSISTGRKY